MKDYLITLGETVKALGDGRIGGYLIAWGSPSERDLQGEYFDADTDLILDSFPIKGERVMYHHGLDKTLGVKRLSDIDEVRVDDVGVWAETQLDMADAYQAKIYEMVQAGKLGWSSGALPQSVLVEPNKRIKRWGVIEGSLTPRPAQPLKTRIMPVKSFLEAFPTEDDSSGDAAPTPEEPRAENLGEAEGAAADNAPTPPSTVEPLLIPPQEDPQEGQVTTMNIQQMIAQFVETMLGQLQQQLSDEDKARAVEQIMQAFNLQPAAEAAALDSVMNDEQKMGELVAAVAKAIKTQLGQENVVNRFAAAAKGLMDNAQPQSRVTGRGAQITGVTDLRYAHLKAEDLTMGAHLLVSAGKAISDDFLRATHDRVQKAVSRDDSAFGADPTAIKSVLPAKADEILASNLSNNGANWVGVAYSTQLWEKAREAIVWQEMRRLGLFEVEITPGMNSIYIPSEGDDPVFYSLVEVNDETSDERLPITAKSSNVTPGRRQLTVGFAGARVSFTDIMDEDSLIPVLPFMRSRMEIAAQEAIEYILINGDTATGANTNINLVDGTPSVDAKGRGPRYLTLNGMLKQALVTTTGLSRDAGGSLTDDDYLYTYNLLPANDVNEDRLLFIVNRRTYTATKNVPAFKTKDTYNAATLEGGRITGIHGVSLVVSGQMPLANTAGKISGTAANNTLGRIMCIRPDRWALAFKREIRTEVARDIDAQATVVVSTFRLGLQSFGNNTGVAVSYNVGVNG